MIRPSSLNVIFATYSFKVWVTLILKSGAWILHWCWRLAELACIAEVWQGRVRVTGISSHEKIVILPCLLATQVVQEPLPVGDVGLMLPEELQEILDAYRLVAITVNQYDAAPARRLPFCQPGIAAHGD